jgi:hypothetical protein
MLDLINGTHPTHANTRQNPVPAANNGVDQGILNRLDCFGW